MGYCTKTPIDKSKFPAWGFVPEPGFRFTDPDGDRVIVIGEGGWREFAADEDKRLAAYGLGVLDFKPWTLVGAYSYKGEWHMIDLCAQPKEWWAKCSPGWADGRDKDRW